MQHRIGIDLGGTKIEIAVLDPDGGERFRHRIDTPHGYPASLEGIAGLVRDAEARLGVTATVGIGIPGVPLQVAAVEPQAFHGQPALAEGQLKQGHPPSPHEQRAPNLGDNAGHLARLQLVQAARILPVFIAEGKVVQKVFSGCNAPGGQQFRDPRSNAANVPHLRLKSGHTSGCY